MSERQHLLTTTQMAQFVNQGFLRFDRMLEGDLCERMTQEIDARKLSGVKYRDCPIEEAAPGTALHDALTLPQVRGVIESLVGPEANFDHYAIHVVPGKQKMPPGLHQDAEYDARPCAFDIQISMFPQDTPREAGGTIFVPGSHLRRVHEAELTRYQQVRGQVQTICDAGTVVFWHHNLWHCAASNQTDRPRYMVKVRLNPRHRQTLLWNTDDLEHPDLIRILAHSHPWELQEHRLELMNRALLWRHLTDNPKFDIFYFLTRIENDPQQRHRQPQASQPEQMHSVR